MSHLVNNRLATMYNAIQTGAKDARVGHDMDASRYGARDGSAWSSWYRWGYDGLPFPQELKDAGFVQ